MDGVVSLPAIANRHRASPNRFWVRGETCIILRMRDMPWHTFALGSLLLISVFSRGGQDLASPQPENSKPPVETEQRGRILGIGGVFFKSANRDQAREWYSKHLGLADTGHGAMLPWREHDDPKKEQMTVWTVFAGTSDYFPAPFMINYLV